jgi:hypothetical protein
MPEISLPEVKLPTVKLPDGLRDMNRDDIVNAAKDVRMPKKLEMPDIDLTKIDLSKIDLSKVELPKQVTDRLPGRKRTNPILPIAGFLAIGAMFATAWWLITSPVTGPRIRRAVNDIKTRMNGEPSDLVRYDNDADLGSLLSDQEPYRSSSPAAQKSGLDEAVPVGPGASAEGVRSN